MMRLVTGSRGLVLLLGLAVLVIGCGRGEEPVGQQALPIQGQALPAQGQAVPVQGQASQPLPVQPQAQAVPVQAAQETVEPGVRYWVWVRNQEPGNERTFDVREVNGQLTVLSEKKGIHLWVAGAPAELRREAHTRKKCTCDDKRSVEVCPAGSFNTVSSAALFTGNKKTPLHQPPGEGTQNMSDLTHALEVLATLGPFAAFRESINYDAPCAAHGSWTTTYGWRDMRTGAPVDILASQPIPKNVKKKLTKKICDKHATCEAGGDGDECAPAITGLEPVWGTNGFVRRYIGAVDAPYACSSDETAYAITDRFGAAPFTQDFKQLSGVPRSVHKFVKTLPSGTSLGGVYQVPGNAPFLKT